MRSQFEPSFSRVVVRVATFRGDAFIRGVMIPIDPELIQLQLRIAVAGTHPLSVRKCERKSPHVNFRAISPALGQCSFVPGEVVYA
jgi:hypothetical protein